MLIGLGLQRSLEAGLRIPEDPKTLTGLGDDVIDIGDDTDDVELAGLIGTVEGAYTDRLAGNNKAMSPLASLVGTSWTPWNNLLLTSVSLDCPTWTWTGGSGAGLFMPVRQLARWFSNLLRTVWSTPASTREKNLLTSLAHSANPDLYLDMAFGSGVIC